MTLLESHTLQLSGDVFMDVNPEESNVQLRIGNTVSGYLPIAELWGAIFAIVGPVQQEMMTPVRTTQVETFIRKHRVKVTKALKPGDFINIKCHINVPVTVTEGLKAIVAQQGTRNPIHFL